MLFEKNSETSLKLSNCFIISFLVPTYVFPPRAHDIIYLLSKLNSPNDYIMEYNYNKMITLF